MPKPRPWYPPEFRCEAVELGFARGVLSGRDVVESLRCSQQALFVWVKRDQLDRRERDDGLTSDEREELRRLRRENARLKQEREILKRAAAFLRNGA